MMKSAFKKSLVPAITSSVNSVVLALQNYRLKIAAKDIIIEQANKYFGENKPGFNETQLNILKDFLDFLGSDDSEVRKELGHAMSAYTFVRGAHILIGEIFIDFVVKSVFCKQKCKNFFEVLEVHASSAIPYFATSIGGVLGGLISDTFGGEVLGFTVQIITIFVLFFILKLIIKPKDNNQIGEEGDGLLEGKS